MIELTGEFLTVQFFLLGIIFWAALGVFGFYRIYHAIAVTYWRTLFGDIDFDKRRDSFDAQVHLAWGIFFYLLPWLMCLILINLLAG